MREADLDLYDAYNADEAFLTSTSLCICPITRINGVHRSAAEGRVWGLGSRSGWPITLHRDYISHDPFHRAVSSNAYGRIQERRRGPSRCGVPYRLSKFEISVFA